MIDFVLSVCVSDEAELWVSLFLRDCSRVWKIHMILIVRGKTIITPWLVHSNKVVLHLTVHTVLIQLVLWYGCVTVEKVLNTVSLNACTCLIWSALWRVRVWLCRFWFSIMLFVPMPTIPLKCSVRGIDQLGGTPFGDLWIPLTKGQ